MTSNRNIHVCSSLQLPNSTICPFQYLNYTLFIEDEGGELVATYGPEQRQGSSVTVQAVTSNLTGGRNYSLKVQVGLQLQSITSNKHHFSKLRPQTETNHRMFVHTVIVALKNDKTRFLLRSEA